MSTRSSTTLPPEEPKVLECKQFRGNPGICNILDNKGMCSYSFKTFQCRKTGYLPDDYFSYTQLRNAFLDYDNVEDEKQEDEEQIDYTDFEQLEKIAGKKINTKLERLITQIKDIIEKNKSELKISKITIQDSEKFDQRLLKCIPEIHDLKDRFTLEQTIQDIGNIDLQNTELIIGINEINEKYSKSGPTQSCFSNIYYYINYYCKCCGEPTTAESEIDILKIILEDMTKLQNLLINLNGNIEEKKKKKQFIETLKETIKKKNQKYSSKLEEGSALLKNLNIFTLNYNTGVYDKRLEEYERLSDEDRKETGRPKTKREALIEILKQLRFEEYKKTHEFISRMNVDVNIFFKEYQFTDYVFPVKIGIDIKDLFWVIYRWGGWRKFDPKKYIIEIFPGEEKLYFPKETDDLINLLKETGEAAKFINSFNEKERDISFTEDRTIFYYAITEKTFFTSNKTSNNECYPVFKYDMSQNEDVFKKAQSTRNTAKRDIKQIFKILKERYGCTLSNQETGFDAKFDPKVLIDIESDKLTWLTPFIEEFDCVGREVHQYPFIYKGQIFKELDL
jgi:hypothetical protein